ncbi:Uma2 family endonuclease [Rubrivirga sp. S365]|uniref:Uma2 family endonuclease n=1 Tax=Rubrivirga sp. S365 TaxID=3076080 RepID=UPI0028C964AA|nr:Uma2 family endonuclease [Rubrivirga sp. S365]MDT7855882.1 Uma2 family endonuclease [Rubrivirga sp. S365]
MTLSDSLVVQPDLVFVSHARDGIVTREGLSGAPDLVAEVLSPSTAYYDLTLKRDVYEARGVSEYWIVDPERKTVAVLAREDGRYRTQADLGATGRAASALLDGFAVEVASLFGSPRRS